MPEFSGLMTNAAPALVNFNNRILCFYRDGGSQERGNGLLMAEFLGFLYRQLGNTLHNVSTGVGAAVFRGELMLFARDPGGNQMFQLSSATGDVTPWRHTWMTTEIDSSPSVACIGDHTLCCVSSGGFTTLVHGKGWQRGRASSRAVGSAALVWFKDELHLYSIDAGGNGIFHSWSRDGLIWNTSPITIGLDSRTGVAVTEFKGTLYLFYSDVGGTALLYATSADGHHFRHAGNTGLETTSRPACVVWGEQILVAAKERDRASGRHFGLYWTFVQA